METWSCCGQGHLSRKKKEEEGEEPSINYIYIYTWATTYVVCGLSFSRPQPDFEGFLRALRFPPSSKLTPSFFQFDRMQDLPENYFRVRGASSVKYH